MSADTTRRTAVMLGLASTLLTPSLFAKESSLFALTDFLALDTNDFQAWLPASNPRQHAALIRAIAAHASRLDATPLPQMYPMGPGAPGMEIGPLGRGRKFAVVAYRAAPNAVLPAHNHPNYSVATLGVAGEAAVSQFEVDANAPPASSSEPFQLQKTSHRILRPGDLVTLTPSADNVHTFVAGSSGAAWIDIAIPNGPDIGFSYLDITGAPEAAVGTRISARWKRSPPKTP